MPPKKIFFKYSQDDVYKALEEIHAGGKIRETARKYNIPHATLINKMKMRHPIGRKMGPPTILTPDEESLLTRWINAKAKKGIPLKKEQLIEAVQNILKKDNRPNPFKQGVPGRKWFNAFLKRNPDVAQRYAESINTARSHVTEAGLRKWHANLKDYLLEMNAQGILEDPDRILNCDESGFQTCPDSGLVLGPKGMKNLFEIKDKEKESITVLGTFSASGKVMPVLVIYPYERIPFEISRNYPEEWCIGKSPKGWMTSKVFYGYIGNSLIPALKNSRVKFPVLLLIDGHKSHISYEVSELCTDNQIILYALHPNATHIIQPADVSVFRPLKHAWKNNVSKWKLLTGNRVVTKAQFAPLLLTTFKAATKQIISNGFRKCGIYPFDANAIDYTKCISDPSRHDNLDKPTEIGPEHVLYFESLMSQNRISEFRNVNENTAWMGDESAKELFYVWRKLRNRIAQSSGMWQDEVDMSNTAESNHDSIRPCTPQPGPSGIVRKLIPNSPAASSTTSDSSRAPSPSMLYTTTNQTSECNSERIPYSASANITEEPDVSRSATPIPIVSLQEIQERTPVKVDNVKISTTQRPELNLDVSVIDKAPKIITTSSCLELTVRQENFECPTNDIPKRQRNVKPSYPKISEAFVNALVWPSESPIKRGSKKKNKQKLPDAINSPMWNKYWEEKNNEKEEKENRKLEREEKKKTKEAKAKAIVKKGKIKQIKPVIESDSDEEKTRRKKRIRLIDSDSEEDEVPLIQLKNLRVGTYVIIKYEGEYFPGIIKNTEGKSKEVSTMVLSSPNTFKWPEKEDRLWYDEMDIVEIIKPPVPTNARGSFRVEEMAKYLQWIE